ncbi:hypothetical protein BDV40DRAFT_283648 [Aspergillus tamarii]|uniref:Uncharacterized protein n=1 Tax=Aspergillus tamarii TaxID=41984 RepID=A0A5N6UA68_ASPTM|nr:hypothetical protein BDV40DRAFT_283648 [Aspergillus tamarii]
MHPCQSNKVNTENAGIMTSQVSSLPIWSFYSHEFLVPGMRVVAPSCPWTRKRTRPDALQPKGMAAEYSSREHAD